MMKNLSILFFIVSFLISCEKSDSPFKNDPNYPTTFDKINSNLLSQIRTDYYQKNKYLITSLTQFGFCGSMEENRVADTPPLLNSLTQTEAIQLVRNFVAVNPGYTGVKNPDDLMFANISSTSLYQDGSISWSIRSTNQKIDSLEVLNSEIVFTIKRRELIICSGNWFPNIYVPAKANFSQDKAKSLLLNKVVSHLTFGSQKYDVTISSADLNKSTIRLVVIPINTGDRIELRLAWHFNIPGPVYYQMCIDIMTGEIIDQQPTIIS